MFAEMSPLATKIGVAIAGLVAAAIAAGIVIKVRGKSVRNKYIVKNNTAGGDVAGRDVNKR